MYCGGYVVHKLLKRMSMEKLESAAKYVATLQSLCEEEYQVSDNEELEDFVQRWMESVNRGSLKILKVQAFDFFKQVELCVYREIEHQMKTTDQVNPDGVIQTVLANVEIVVLACS